MTKTNKIRSALLALVCACCLAPVAVAMSGGAFNEPAPALVAAEESPKAEAAPVAVETPSVVEMPEVLITAKARGKARSAARKAQEKPACRLHVLEQGGSPSAPFVVVCG